MALPTSGFTKQYDPNGVTTVFSFPFKVLSSDDFGIVSVPDGSSTSTVISPGDYTLIGIGDNGGVDIVFSSAPASGFTLIATRELSLLQQFLALETDGDFPSSKVEAAFDRVVMMIQQISGDGSDLDRAIKFPLTEPEGFNPYLAGTSLRAGTTLGFNSLGALTYLSEIPSPGRQHNYTATATPTVSNDGTEGYSVGSFWIYPGAGRAWVCANTTTGSAQWLEIGVNAQVSGYRYSVTQSSHGFSDAQAIYWNGSAWALSDNTSLSTSLVHGVVETITDANNFTVVLAGAITVSSLPTGEIYLGTSGALTGTKPSNPAYVKVIGFGLTSTLGIINISPFEVLET